MRKLVLIAHISLHGFAREIHGDPDFELVKTVDAAAYGKIPTVFCDPNASGHTLQQAR